jgi:ParB-like chromosome segregation protein Spo0J
MTPSIVPNWPALHIEMVPIAELIPYCRNPRQHSEAQIRQLAGSMKEFGWTMPVLRGEDNGIIAGHGRVMAAQLLGWPEAPVATATGWSESKKRAYVIADNKLALNATWGIDLLATEIEALREQDFSLDLLGFSDEDLARLADDLAADQFGAADIAARQTTQVTTVHVAVDLVVLSIPMTPEQRTTTLEAIERAKATLKLEQSGEALCRIAKRFLETD